MASARPAIDEAADAGERHFRQDKTFAQRLSQSLNLRGVSSFADLAWRDPGLALPQLEVADLSQVDWSALRAKGFRGVVFDKDNTLTAPFATTPAAREKSALEAALAAFGRDRVAVISNSAGLEAFDPEGLEAQAVEAQLGVPVLRHREKKPACDASEVERAFGCRACEMVMVGDRYLTDVAWGNRQGMLTVRPTPLTERGEPLAVRAARRVEETFVRAARARGVRPKAHPLWDGGEKEGQETEEGEEVAQRQGAEEGEEVAQRQGAEGGERKTEGRETKEGKDDE